MTIRATRDAIVDAIRTALPDSDVLKTCTHHPGPFTIEQVKEYSRSAPAAIVSVIGSNGMDYSLIGAEASAPFEYHVYIICRGKTRDEQALALLELIYPVLCGVTGQRSIRVDNLFSLAVDNDGLAMWQVTLIVSTDFTLNPDPVELDDFLQLVTAWAPGGVPGPLDPDTGEPDPLSDALIQSIDVRENS